MLREYRIEHAGIEILEELGNSGSENVSWFTIQEAIHDIPTIN